MNLYEVTGRLSELYGALQDERSREIFWARLQADVEWDAQREARMNGMLRLGSLYYEQNCAGMAKSSFWTENFLTLWREKKKIILYGTRVEGRAFATRLLAFGMDFHAFCGRGFRTFSNGLMGKPVISPMWLVQEGRDAFVVITASNTYGSYDEILDFLMKSNFPEDHILSMWDAYHGEHEQKQYFEFPEFYRAGTAFVDGGCYGGESSVQFASWSRDGYSRIFAFEPDPANYAKAERELKRAGLRNMELYEAGLSDESAEADFYAAANTGSSILPGETRPEQTRQYIINRIAEGRKRQRIRTVRLDDIVGDEPVGFIKMDIEGAEYAALHGAERTIRRDKPLLAICVYHKSGDMLAIMDYCEQLAPEYRFWLRQYDVFYETVLYASVGMRERGCEQ